MIDFSLFYYCSVGDKLRSAWNGLEINGNGGRQGFLACSAIVTAVYVY